MSNTTNNFENNLASVIDAAKKKNCVCVEQEPLRKYTTFKIGGNARVMIFIDNVDALSEIYSMCVNLRIPCFVIGNGSNLLVSDDGYNGVVMKLDNKFKDISPIDESGTLIRCGAGVTLAKLCKYALDNSLSGLEFAWGIPGTVGGAAFMNAGAYDGEMKNVIESVSCILPDGTIQTVDADNLNMSYRHSVFSDNAGIITSVTMRLKSDNQKLIRDRMDDFMNRRRSKQPLEYPSAGSVFKRPEGYYAGKLIEDCGLKGTMIGGAQVSEKHAGFIINKSDASCSDVRELIKHIQDTVERETGVKLECEIRMV